MIILTKDQKELRKRLHQAIEQEIYMCDDYADLIVLSSTLYDSAKHLFSVYSKKYGEQALNFGENENKD